MEPGVVEGLFCERDAARCNLESERFGCRDFIINVDFIDHGEPDDAPLVLTDGAMPEPRRLEHEAVTQVEAVLDAWSDPIQIRDRLLQPAKCLAQPRVDRLERLDIGVIMSRLARCLVLDAQFVEQRRSVRHGHALRQIKHQDFRAVDFRCHD